MPSKTPHTPDDVKRATEDLEPGEVVELERWIRARLREIAETERQWEE